MEPCIQYCALVRPYCGRSKAAVKVSTPLECEWFDISYHGIAIGLCFVLVTDGEDENMLE